MALPAESEAYLSGLALPTEILPRVRMTVGCGDCAPVPKVPGAGEVVGNRQRMHNGVEVVADGYCGPWMTAIIRLLDGHHEPQEEWAFHTLLQHVRPASTMLELGSYWAYYSLWYLHHVPGAEAVMVEPDPAFIEVGRANFALNGRSGEFHPAAVGAATGRLAEFRCESDGVMRPTPVVCVDDLMAGREVELLLSDIQGAELQMLHGAARTIAEGRLRFLVLSTHHHSISGDPLTHQRCLEFVLAHGGVVLTEHSVSESFSGDGLIVASFAPDDRDLPRIEVSHNRASTSLFAPLEHDLADSLQEAARLREALADAEDRLGASDTVPPSASFWTRLVGRLGGT